MRPQARCQNFHTSPSLSARKPPPRQLRRLTKAQAEKRFPKYTEEELARLPERYTPQQIEAIKAGEEAVSPEDLVKRGVIRSDVGAVSYFDDFRHTIGVLDRPQPYTGPKDPNPRLMTMNEMVAEVERVEEKLEKEFDEEMAAKPPPEKDAKDRKGGEEEEEPPTFPRRIDILRLLDQTSGTMGSYGKAVPVEQETNYLAPGLPKKFMEDETAEKEVFDEDQEPDPRDPDGQYNKLIKQSGMTLDEIFELKLKVLVSHRVVNQTRLGKIQSVYILCIAGNGDGRLGIGEAKGQESESTLSNARISAIRNMKPIPRYEGRTIFGNVEGKVSAVEVQLMARPPGKPSLVCNLQNSS